MKLCIVVPYFTPYIRSNEYGLAETLTKLGYDVTIIASRGEAPRDTKKDSTGVFDYDFKVEYLSTLLNIADNPIVTGLNLKGYDIVLLQEDYPFICHKAYKEAKKLGIKTILSSERTYYPVGLKRVVLRYLDRTTNRKLRDGVDILTTHCSEARGFMKEIGVERDIKIIHVGVDTNLFKPIEIEKKYLLDDRYFNILTVARLHKYKGLEYLIRAIKHVDKAKLYVLGWGSEEKNLLKLIENLNLESKVEFIPRVIPNYRMPMLYSICDVYVQPSIVEPYGIAVLEAMACGKPVIGTRVGGIIDTIEDQKTGFLIKPRSTKELVEKLEILKDKEIREEMGLRARERAVKNFDWVVIGKEYQKVIEDLI